MSPATNALASDAWFLRLRFIVQTASLAFFWCDGMIAHTMVGGGVPSGTALYDIYRLRETADGALVVIAASDSEFHGLLRAVRRADLIEDARFRTLADRDQNVDLLEQILIEEFKKWPAAEILARLIAEDVPAGPVHALDEVIDDPQVRHNQAVIESDHPLAGRMRQTAPPARFERTPSAAGAPAPAPALGQHTDEVLNEIGVDAVECAQLRADGVIG